MRHYVLISLFILQQSTFNSQVLADYSNPEHWVISPQHDTSLHKAFISDSSLISYADVFYVCPTVYLDKKHKEWNVSIDNVEQRARTKNVTRLQASAWSESGRMFAAYTDIKKAFQYYLDHYNQGRPIILAGHSQGSTHILLLMKDFFDGKDLQEQLICAYIPGIGVTENEFKTIPLLTNKDQVGGYVCWNTFKRRYKTKKYKDWYKGKTTINPVTWDKSTFARKKDHKGFLYWDEKMYVQSFNTHLIDGAIWITIPNVPFRSLSVAMKDYHIGDVNLFWKDIQINAKERVISFKKNELAKTANN